MEIYSTAYITVWLFSLLYIRRAKLFLWWRKRCWTDLLIEVPYLLGKNSYMTATHRSIVLTAPTSETSLTVTATSEKWHSFTINYNQLYWLTTQSFHSIQYDISNKFYYSNYYWNYSPPKAMLINRLFESI